MKQKSIENQECQVESVDRLIAIKEVAKQLSMSVKTMERRFEEGLLPLPERVGKHRKRVYRASMIPVLIEHATRRIS